MADKWTDHRNALSRIHDDLFSGSLYTADFFNYADGSYDPSTGEMTGQSRDSSAFASLQVEMVPPGMDTTVDVDGTSFSWDTSIRFPEDKLSQGDLVTLGDDADKPTEVELSDPQESSNTVYELHGYSVEKGSGMLMCRLVEQ